MTKPTDETVAGWRTIRVRPVVAPKTEFDPYNTAGAPLTPQWSPWRHLNAVTWYAEDLTLDDAKAPLWRRLCEAETRPALMDKLKAGGHLLPGTVVTLEVV